MNMTTGNVARLLGVGLNTVKRWISSGALRAVCTPGGHWRISNDDLDLFMRANGMKVPNSGKLNLARVLVVDDDPSACALYEAVLEQIDIPLEVQCVHDGYTGLMKIGAWRPDILVLDILMPGINGLEVLHRIRENTKGDNMAVIVVTAIPEQPEVMSTLKSAGVVAVLPKPLEVQRFIDVTSACLTLAQEYHVQKTTHIANEVREHG